MARTDLARQALVLFDAKGDDVDAAATRRLLEDLAAGVQAGDRPSVMPSGVGNAVHDPTSG